MSLADVQAAVRDFVVAGRGGALAGALVGGDDPLRRLAIHRRHYHASLTAALAGKFPGTAWLLGERELVEAAEAFVTVHPPTAPCIAEYGAEFPRFVGERVHARAPYAEAFATLEWHMGHVSVAVDAAPADAAAVVMAGADPVNVTCTLQPGARYLRLDWPVDTLFGFFLAESAPESFRITPEPIGLQVRGARGEFRFDRLAPARFAFRAALAASADMDSAVDAALAADPSADVMAEVAALFAEDLVALIEHRAAVGA